MTRPPPTPTDDYDLIEAAVMDTARGRWFLSEFARRNRSADTQILLEAIERLEKRLAEVEAAPPKPHEPVAETDLRTSAGSELFALEPPLAVPPDFMLPSLPDDVAWLGSDDEVPATPPADIVEIDDENLILPPPARTERQPAPRTASAQSAMLAAALAQAEQTPALAPETPPEMTTPANGTPPPADPAELDALSFEEKSVYFA